MNFAAILNGTRGQIVTLIRGGTATVNGIAAELGLTQNAVRAHLLSLEKDHLIEIGGQQPSTRRPAQVYKLTAAAEAFYARGYEPVLNELAKILSNTKGRDEVERLFKTVGENLGVQVAPLRGSLNDRLNVAIEVLTSLGAVVEVEEGTDGILLRGRRCPLASLVSTCPEACSLGVALVESILQIPVEEKCVKHPTPACRFLVKTA